MAISIKEISTRSEIRKFIKFAHRHYKGNPCYVPTLITEETDTLSPKKNPAFEFCDHIYYMAYKDGKPVGRIAGIINHRSNEIWNEKRARFGWVEFTDDSEVSRALFEAIENWAISKGATAIHGPLGFSDLDYEGMLIEGFDQLSTMVTIYNYSYYPSHIENLGYAKDADWIEFRIKTMKEVPERYLRVAEIARKRHNLTVRKFSSVKEIRENRYDRKIFHLLNESYAQLYGYVPLTDAQIEYYLKIYIPMLYLDFVTLVTDANDNAIAVGIAFPSLSRALQRCGGKLLPFGFIHLLRALKAKGRRDTVDLYLIGVRPDFQGKGVNALLFNDLSPRFYAKGFRYAESNPELETNLKVQLQWGSYEHVQHKRRRAYIKELGIRN
ncbi:MAG: N-acetyltransferase [Bacteroidales bacterium]|jgi:hypothetical protein|nr:N-acetyltransferase [Bacteroidales bacterium]